MIIVSAIVLSIGIIAMIFGTTLNSISDKKSTLFTNFCAGIAISCFASAIILPTAIPRYEVWRQNKAGEAELARAEQNRKIAVEEAKAKEEAAKSLANAEIIRAQGVAQANKIIGDSLQNNDAYIHYLWIEALRESSNEVIYIPTEACIPITESTRFFRKGAN